MPPVVYYIPGAFDEPEHDLPGHSSGPYVRRPAPPPSPRRYLLAFHINGNGHKHLSCQVEYAGSCAAPLFGSSSDEYLDTFRRKSNDSRMMSHRTSQSWMPWDRRTSHSSGS